MIVEPTGSRYWVWRYVLSDYELGEMLVSIKRGTQT